MSPLEYVIKLDDRGFSGPLGNARRGVDGLNRGVGDLSRKGAGVNSLGGAFTSLAAKIGAAFTAYKALEMGFSGLGKSIKTAADMETTSTAMRVLIGDADKSAALIQRIKKMGAETPFEFPELATAGKMLLAFGESAEAVPETLRRIGDVSSGVAAPIGEIAEIYGKARTAGTLFSEDINQLTGRGIPIIREFAKILGKPEGEIKKLAEEGKITFPLLDQAFRNMTSSGGQFFGMMAEQSGTVNGLLSSLSDAANDLFLEFGKPLNDALRPVLADAISLAGELKPAIAEMGVVAGGLLATTRNFVMEAGKGGGLAAAMGEQLKLALEKAGEALMIPIGAIGAAMPSLGKAMLAAMSPTVSWLENSLISAALKMGAVMAEELALVLADIPGMGGTADRTMARSGAMERRARGSDQAASEALAAGDVLYKFAGEELGRGVETAAKELKKRLDKFAFSLLPDEVMGQLPEFRSEGMAGGGATVAAPGLQSAMDGVQAATSQNTNEQKEATKALRELSGQMRGGGDAGAGGRSRIVSARDGSTRARSSDRNSTFGPMSQFDQAQAMPSAWKKMQEAKRLGVSSWAGMPGFGPKAGGQMMGGGLDWLHGANPKLARPAAGMDMTKRFQAPQVRSPGAAKANVEAREKMQSRQQHQQAGQNGGQSEMLSALQQIAAHTAKLKVVS